jgi:carbon monoxide dehydrogenase subunit G
MTKIESKKVQLNVDCETAFTYLRDLDNLIEFLPQSKITEWKSDKVSCSFKVQGSYQIGMKHGSEKAPEHLKLLSGEGSPFPFELNIYFAPHDTGCIVSQLCEAQINPFLEMIVKGPLKNLFDYIADKMVDKFGGKVV